MEFNPNNPIIRLCMQGMAMEEGDKHEEAGALFNKAWNESTNDFEKFTSAHYVARHQETVAEKLKWDETALQLALNINDETMKASYPSLYLNIAKCYEDLEDKPNALKHYQLANSFAGLLPDDGYGKMIKSGIANGLKRVRQLS